MFVFKNYVMKIMSKSRSRHLVRLQGNIKTSQKRKKLHIRKLYSSMFQCTSHQPISVADLGSSVNHVKLLISFCLQNLRLSNVALGATKVPVIGKQDVA